jgi:hypothetical protein
MERLFKALYEKYSPLAKTHGIDPKSPEWIKFMQQAAKMKIEIDS